MREQSGRSLIEIIGVLAIGIAMVGTTISVYRSTNEKQKRLVASQELKDIATHTKTLLEYSGYQNVSVDFLIESGALKSDKSPIGSNDWSITSSIDGSEFFINLNGLNFEECAYFSIKKFDWATGISINGYSSSDSSYCLKTGDNKISFTVK